MAYLFSRTDILPEILRDANEVASGDDRQGYESRNDSESHALGYPGVNYLVAFDETATSVISVAAYDALVLLIGVGLSARWEGARGFFLSSCGASVVLSIGVIATTAARLTMGRFFTFLSPLYYQPLSGLSWWVRMIARADAFSLLYVVLIGIACRQNFGLTASECVVGVVSVWVMLGLISSLTGVSFYFLL